MAAAALILLTSCGSKKPAVQTAGYFNYTTECLGKQADGTQLLKVYAKGVDRADAVREAKKKAIEEVLFKGVSAGDTECSAYPVVDAPNARQKYEDYFNKFFKDSGNFKKYVDEVDKDGPCGSTKLAQGDVVTGLDGETITTFSEIYNVLEKHKDGDKVTLKYYQASTGKETEEEITLAADK